MAKKKRVIHYRSYSHFSFPCCQKEMQRHIDSSTETREAFGGVSTGYRMVLNYTTPSPQTRADLRQVTCPECWRNILAMALSFKEPVKAFITGPD